MVAFKTKIERESVEANATQHTRIVDRIVEVYRRGDAPSPIVASPLRIIFTSLEESADDGIDSWR